MTLINKPQRNICRLVKSNAKTTMIRKCSNQIPLCGSPIHTSYFGVISIGYSDLNSAFFSLFEKVKQKCNYLLYLARCGICIAQSSGHIPGYHQHKGRGMSLLHFHIGPHHRLHLAFHIHLHLENGELL